MRITIKKELKDYGPPTYRAYDRECDQLEEWKRQAAALPIAEIKRHAAVSTENRCGCGTCFCCACAAVVEECWL